MSVLFDEYLAALEQVFERVKTLSISGGSSEMNLSFVNRDDLIELQKTLHTAQGVKDEYQQSPENEAKNREITYHFSDSDYPYEEYVMMVSDVDYIEATINPQHALLIVSEYHMAKYADVGEFFEADGHQEWHELVVSGADFTHMGTVVHNIKIDTRVELGKTIDEWE